MTVEELTDLFEAEDSIYLKFEDIENPRHPRPDICAFLMLHDILGGEGTSDMVSAAEHDQIFLDGSLEALAPVITEDQVKDLIRCGVHTDDYGDGLAMFA